MAQIDSIDNLIAEFEKTAPAISQLQDIALTAATLTGKLSQVLTDADQRMVEIETARQRLKDNLSEVGKLKQSLELRITESKTLESNVGKELRRLKDDVLAAIGDLRNKKSGFGVAIATFSTSSTQLLSEKSTLADQAIADLKNTKEQELNDLKAKFDKTLQDFNTQSGPLLAGIPGLLQQFDRANKQAITDFEASVKTEISSLPSKFDQLRERLAKAMQTHVGNEQQRFLERQNNLVSNLNQRIDSLENLSRTQQATAAAQLDLILSRMKQLEVALEKRGGGILGLFR